MVFGQHFTPVLTLALKISAQGVADECHMLARLPLVTTTTLSRGLVPTLPLRHRGRRQIGFRVQQSQRWTARPRRSQRERLRYLSPTLGPHPISRLHCCQAFSARWCDSMSSLTNRMFTSDLGPRMLSSSCKNTGTSNIREGQSRP